MANPIFANFTNGTLNSSLANTDATVDFVVSNQYQRGDGTYYDLTDDIATGVIQDIELTVKDINTNKVELMRISTITANGTTSDGRPRYTLTIETNGGTKLRGMANTYDGTNALTNVIASNIVSLFPKNSVALIAVNAGIFNRFAQNVASATTRVIQAYIFDGATDVSIGDGKYYAVAPSSFNGLTLNSASATVLTAGTTGDSTVQIYNATTATDVLSTPITIASGAASGTGVIDAGAAVISTGDILRFDVDSVSTTPPKGLIVSLEYVL